MEAFVCVRGADHQSILRLGTAGVDVPCEFPGVIVHCFLEFLEWQSNGKTKYSFEKTFDTKTNVMRVYN